MKQKLLAIASMFLVFPVCASSLTESAAQMKKSEQMLVVTAPQWDSATGSLQRFERKDKSRKWEMVGKAIPVVVGKHGMAWGNELQIKSDQAPTKKEGDGRTPVGIYKIGPLFGFDAKSPFKLDYFPLTETSVCVDDDKSVYYNQLLDSAKVPKVDWKSGEQMRQVSQYQIGGVIQYNDHPPVAGGGSCIFIHIWKNPTAGTAGCVAMEEANLSQVLNWLDPKKNPVIVVFPLPAYTTVKTVWHLPQLA